MRKNSVSTCFCAAAAAITAKISKFHQIGGYPVGRAEIASEMRTLLVLHGMSTQFLKNFHPVFNPTGNPALSVTKCQNVNFLAL
jgi:hypothetical protein